MCSCCISHPLLGIALVYFSEAWPELAELVAAQPCNDNTLSLNEEKTNPCTVFIGNIGVSVFSRAFPLTNINAEHHHDEEAVKQKFFPGADNGLLSLFIVRSRDSLQQSLSYGFGHRYISLFDVAE